MHYVPVQVRVLLVLLLIHPSFAVHLRSLALPGTHIMVHRTLASRRRPRRDLSVVSEDPLYRQSLHRCYLLFCSFVASVFGDIDIGKSARHTDQMLERYLQKMYDSRVARYLGVHTVLAVQQKHGFRLRLNRAWSALKVWRMQEPCKTRYPIPQNVLFLYIAHCLSCGMNASGLERLRWFICGVVFMTGFAGLMRPNEMARFLRCDVALPCERAETHTKARALICCYDAKNRRVLGRTQIIIVDCAQATAWLTWLLRDFPRDARVYAYAQNNLAKFFKRIGRRFSCDFLTIASIRTGAATTRFQRHRNIGRLMFEGRWGDERTLRHYLQESLSMYVHAQLTAQTHERIATVSQLWPCLALPPALSLRSLVGDEALDRYFRTAVTKGRRVLAAREHDGHQS